jgi:hypothetical protein
MRIKWVAWACFLVLGIAVPIVPSASAQDTSTPEERAQWDCDHTQAGEQSP